MKRKITVYVARNEAHCSPACIAARYPLGDVPARFRKVILSPPPYLIIMCPVCGKLIGRGN